MKGRSTPQSLNREETARAETVSAEAAGEKHPGEPETASRQRRMRALCGEWELMASMRVVPREMARVSRPWRSVGDGGLFYIVICL